VVKQGVAAQDMLDAFAAELQLNPAGKIVQAIVLFDEYRGKGLEADEKSLAFRFSLQDTQTTLQDDAVDALMGVLPLVLDATAAHQVVIDVGSTKQALLAAVAGHPRRGRFVAAHPMAGTEHSGPEAAVSGLFEGKTVVICDAEHSDADAVATVTTLFQALPMRLLHLNGADHDVHTAYVSHISHITSFALALTVLHKEKEEQRIFDLASGGFESTVRLAKSAPATWVPIFRQNRLNVLDVLDGLDGGQPSTFRFAYEDSGSVEDKVTVLATRVYGAAGVTFSARARRQLAQVRADGFGHLPVCVAKTQYSFSTDPTLRGAPHGHTLNVREVRLAAGAEFVVVVCGDVMTMPGLPKVPAAERIDLVDGKVVGLF